MKKIFSIITLLVIFMSGCKDNPDIMIEREKRLLQQYFEQNNISAEPLASGIYYFEDVAGTGLSPVRGDFVIIKYTGQLIDGKVFDTTDEQFAILKGIFNSTTLYGPSKIKLENLTIRGIEEALKIMKEGGKARIIVPSTLGYGRNIVTNVPAYSTLIYDLELIKVIKDVAAWENEEIENYLALYNDSIQLTVNTKSYKINDKDYNWYYIEIKEGQGDSIKKDFKVYIFYEGKLVDGRIFDRNFGNTSPFTFTVGGNSVIKGMDLAVQEMKKDGRARVLFPSQMGYGELGSGKIPPFSPLVFDILVTNFDTIQTPQ